jgi:hypothetical protein
VYLVTEKVVQSPETSLSYRKSREVTENVVQSPKKSVDVRNNLLAVIKNDYFVNRIVEAVLQSAGRRQKPFSDNLLTVSCRGKKERRKKVSFC